MKNLNQGDFLEIHRSTYNLLSALFLALKSNVNALQVLAIENPKAIAFVQEQNKDLKDFEKKLKDFRRLTGLD